MKLATRALGLLPSGTLMVGAGLAVLGAGSYAQLAIADHSTAPAGKAAMSVLWAIVFMLGIGLFFPVEQELIRLVAGRKHMERVAAFMNKSAQIGIPADRIHENEGKTALL